MKARAATTRRRTRIQRENEEVILDAALEIFASHGFAGATIDRIAAAAGMSKPNTLYYFRSKEDIHNTLIARLLDSWLAPLRAIEPDGDPLDEITGYAMRKLEMAQSMPRQSRLFANEILRGAPNIMPMLAGELKSLVDEKASVIEKWVTEGRLAPCDPHHLIFSIWATTQHYADFDVQVCAVLGTGDNDSHFDDAEKFLRTLYTEALKPRGN